MDCVDLMQAIMTIDAQPELVIARPNGVTLTVTRRGGIRDIRNPQRPRNFTPTRQDIVAKDWAPMTVQQWSEWYKARVEAGGAAAPEPEANGTDV